MLASQTLDVLWAIMKSTYSAWAHSGGTPQNMIGDLKQEYQATLEEIMKELANRK